MYSSYCRLVSSLPKASLVTAARDAALQSLCDDLGIPCAPGYCFNVQCRVCVTPLSDCRGSWDILIPLLQPEMQPACACCACVSESSIATSHFCMLSQNSEILRMQCNWPIDML